MKAEIDNENKAKFFALYWGQKVYRNPEVRGFESTVGGSISDERVPKTGYLELKPLSDISDEDAEECGYDNAKYMLSDNYLINSPRVFDYLRSKGYLLPWMGLSCEELIEAGWAKYKE